MVVKVSTDYDSTVGVLAEYVSDDLEYSQCSVLVIEVITTLQVHIQNLYLYWTGGQSSP